MSALSSEVVLCESTITAVKCRRSLRRVRARNSVVDSIEVE